MSFVSRPGYLHLECGALTGSAARSRLLIIEADEAVAAALSRGLTRYRWTVLWASTAKADLQLQAEWAPHVVLLALDLPDMPTGRLISCLARKGNCSILMLSGHGDDLRRMALAHGAHDVISKPVRAGEVADRIWAVQRRLDPSPPMPALLP